MRRALLALITLVALCSPAIAGTVLKEGAYEIEVRLELPYVSLSNTRKVERVCLGTRQSATFGLAVLSNNNPLGTCPASNAKLSMGTLTFDVRCKGVNAAAGHATYEIMPEYFRGRIEMKMGGKNMTMTEVQVGRRVGACDM